MRDNTVMTSLININSPLTFDNTMMGALEVYAKNNQACIVSPFIVGGAMAPVSVVGTLTQVLAEVMAGVAYSQLVRIHHELLERRHQPPFQPAAGMQHKVHPAHQGRVQRVGRFVGRLGIGQF